MPGFTFTSAVLLNYFSVWLEGVIAPLWTSVSSSFPLLLPTSIWLALLPLTYLALPLALLWMDLSAGGSNSAEEGKNLGQRTQTC